MNDWSKSAAQKYAIKRDREILSEKIIPSEGTGKWEYLRELFTEHIRQFNFASGNSTILDLILADDGRSFRITCKGSPRFFKAVFDKTKNLVDIEGTGQKFNERIRVHADIHSQTAYFVNSQLQPIDEKDFVTRALDTLLEIGELT